MNLKQLRYFLIVAQEQQLTSAAKLLYIAQPPLSYQMKQLEKELGTKLFIRESHGITLTEAGKIFQRYAQQVINLTNETTDELNKEQNGTRGIIRMGLISSAGSIVPNKAMINFTKFYPDISFRIYEDNTINLIDKLQNGMVDIAIVRTPFNMQDLAKIDIITDKMAAVYNPRYYSFNSNELKLADFAQQPLILYRRFETIFNNSFAQQGIHPYYAVKCDDARTSILWADRGMGIALVPSSIAKEYTQQQIKTIDYSQWQSKIQLVWRKNYRIKPVTQRFIDTFTNHLA
ncbi:LysR family transcriptional regulator [Limosilactobacillus reuteri]|uniref:LysR family transcriptional regulator n=1 Tax=Limosilactobacillus reuteri TaxID=1598 RepID=UPI001E4267C4|nr:LysR family transcriptional regulator [Limosilactobacillus reuteri]MCC4371654.1 LysR family transcriptional regulator [Limosilactobacillus reuteri]